MGFFEVFGGILSGIYAVVKSYGLAIILLTILTRIVLLPLSIKQTRSMREMQRIQPEVKKIQAKHKGDKQKMNQEMMALYKEHGVNPFGGCLPLLMQFPVLIALFNVLRKPLSYMGDTALARDLAHHTLSVHQFLGIRLDCTAQFTIGGKAPTMIPGTQQTPVCGDGIVDALPYLLLVLLMGVTTWYQQRQMQAATQRPDGQQAQQMQMIGKIMPAFLMFFAFTFQSGLVLYWLTTNVWTIGQQRLMLAKAPPIPAAGGPGGNGKGDSARQLKKPDAAKSGSAGNGTDGKPTGPQNGAGRQKQPSSSKPNPNAKKKKKR
ncbi:MAG: YidC/Oxa1 family rane protein insertase [Actinomycetota bacterium]|jgi:YidC/Oxa1 family membrane protein insertase|nr:YidC/Oxa1 family rane protein insertase [Actinomycetota bacterium]